MRTRYFLFVLFIYGCKKNSDDNAKPQLKLTFEARFYMKKPCMQSLQDSVQFIDSVMIFTNLSRWSVQYPDTMPLNPDTLNHTKSYKWDFGDNSFSNSEQVTHVYTQPGDYKVSLVTYIDNMPADTFSRKFHVIIGQREIKTSYTYTTCIDMEQAENNGLLILLSSFTSFTDSPAYSLLKLDSLLKPVWTVKIPGNNVRLNSLKKIDDNSYILSGNYANGNTDQFAISRITSTGTLVWTKYIDNLSGTNVNTIATLDGGFLTIGDTSKPVNPYPVIVKCNANGDEVWRRSFYTGLGQSIRSPDNIIETNSGFLFAGFKPGGTNGKIMLTALDQNGNTTQQSETDVNNSEIIFRTGIVKNGTTYMAYATNSTTAYFFSDNLSFLSTARVSQTGTNHSVSLNGSFYIAEGLHQYSYINKLSTSGAPIWSSIIGHNIAISCGSFLSGATRYCEKVLGLGNDVVALSYGENNPNSFNSSSVYVEKFSQSDGSIK